MKRSAHLIVLFTLGVTFTIALAQFRRVFGIASPYFGLMVMLNFLGLVAFARPLFMLRLPSFLRKDRAWEATADIYKALYVPTFGAVLRRTPLRYLNPAVYLKRCPNPSLLQAQIESAEAVHLLAAALLVPYQTYACARGCWGAVVWLTGVQIGFNLYPILHLRYTRARLNRLTGRIHPGRNDDRGPTISSRERGSRLR